MTPLRAPYLKAALIFATLLALYGGFYLATRTPFSGLLARAVAQRTAPHVPRGFVCHMHVLSKTEFTMACVPDCRIPPERVRPDGDSYLFVAFGATPEVWHRACDGKHR